MPGSMQILLVTALWLLVGAIYWAILLRGGLRFERRPRGEDGALPDLDLVPLVRANREARVRSPLHGPTPLGRAHVPSSLTERARQWTAVRRN